VAHFASCRSRGTRISEARHLLAGEYILDSSVHIDKRVTWAVTAGVGVAAALLAAVFDHNVPIRGTDFNWAVRAARDLLAGADPYARPFGPNAIPYPLPAAVVALPFAPLADLPANALFAGLGSAAMAYALVRGGHWWRLLVFLSPSYLMALKHIQWSPLFFAAVLLPWLAPVVTAKPTLGLAAAAATSWQRMNVAVLAAIVALAFALQPDWPLRWYPQTRGYYGFLPIATLPGVVLILAAPLWRQWRGRLLMVFSVMPQHVFFYDQLLLYHVPQTRRELMILLISGWLAFLGMLAVYDARVGGWLIVIGLYLPSLAMLWRRRRSEHPREQ
jgi:hypothetical protein